MYKMKFMDGTPVPEDYEKAVSSIVTQACDAQDVLSPEFIDKHGTPIKITPEIERGVQERPMYYPLTWRK